MTSEYLDDEGRAARKNNLVMFCSILFMGALVVADVTSVKIFQTKIFGFTVLFPAGTLAFAVTFLCTDVLIEVAGKRTGIKLVWFSVAVRLLILTYFIVSIGDESGAVGPLYIPFFGNVGRIDIPIFWTPADQQHYSFIFGGTIPIYVAGFVAVIVSFLNDVYLFSYLREKHKKKNLYWLRNALSTTISQIINSTIFISLAFGASLTIKQIMLAIIGQCVVKIALAWLDTPLAYFMRNYGQGRRYWYAFWRPSLFLKG